MASTGYVYDCKGEEVNLQEEDKTETKHGYFIVHCDKCCNVSVVHLIRVKGRKTWAE
jgi:hypothetical protein